MDQTATTTERTENLAKLACAYAGLVWGLFWIPLRALDRAGVGGAWATAMFFAVPLAFAVPFALWRWRRLLGGGWRLHAIGITAGVSLALYSNALIYTEVVRAILLFYLTPVWSTLLAWMWLKEAITASRLIAILLGLTGMAVIFGIDVGVPWPRNSGDWMGLASGAIWAVAAVLMRQDERTAVTEMTIAYLAWGTLASVLIALAPFSGAPRLPSPEAVGGTLFWFLPVMVFLVMPATFAFMWGTPLLSPGLVGLLFMTEISVGAITAALWAGEPFGLREVAGVALITLAGLAEAMAALLVRRRGAGGSDS